MAVGISLGMPMRLPEFQWLTSNPNHRIPSDAADIINSAGVQSSNT